MALLRGFVRTIRRIAGAGVAGTAALALLLAREGFTGEEAVLVALLLAAPAIVLFFAQGVAELAALPDRVRRLPGESQEGVAELTRLAGRARTTRVRGVPLLLWRLRGTVGSIRGIAGFALPLRVLTPGFVGVTAIAAFVCLGLAVGGVIALIMLANNS